jgi:hypothetical protein
MFLVGILSWWYGGGVSSRIQIIKNRLKSSADFFSIGLLFSTLFAPYRQISADSSTSANMSDRMHAFLDRSISRLVGAVMRFFMIIFGLVALLVQSIFGFLLLIFWLILPLFPAIGIIAAIIGLVPQWVR